MNCEEALNLLDALAGGTLAGERARLVRSHFASCPACAAKLNPVEWMEILPAMDVLIEPSDTFALRFREKLRSRPEPLRGRWMHWGWPRQLAAAGALALLILAGLFVFRYRDSKEERAGYLNDIRVAENLPLLEDMPVISNIELLEDFDTIENLPGLMKDQSRN